MILDWLPAPGSPPQAIHTASPMTAKGGVEPGTGEHGSVRLDQHAPASAVRNNETVVPPPPALAPVASSHTSPEGVASSAAELASTEGRPGTVVQAPPPRGARITTRFRFGEPPELVQSLSTAQTRPPTTARLRTGPRVFTSCQLRAPSWVAQRPGPQVHPSARLAKAISLTELSPTQLDAPL